MVGEVITLTRKSGTYILSRREKNKIYVKNFGWRNIYYEYENKNELGNNFIMIKGERIYF